MRGLTEDLAEFDVVMRQRACGFLWDGSGRAKMGARAGLGKRAAGKGWPEECPPIRAANAFGFDLLANFDVTFVRGRRGWSVVKDIVIDSDFSREQRHNLAHEG